MQFPKGELQVSHCTDQSSTLLQVVLELKAAAVVICTNSVQLKGRKSGFNISCVCTACNLWAAFVPEVVPTTFCSGTNMTHFLSSQKAAQIVFKFKNKNKSKE